MNMNKIIYYPQSNLTQNLCVWGMPLRQGGIEIDQIPAQTKGLFFYEGAKIEVHVLRSALQQTAQQLTHLVIGFCHHPKKDTHLRYNEILYVLNDFHFPELQYLELGVDELLANEHCAYGNLGNLTQILENVPKLETLALYGNFELDKPMIHHSLKKLHIIMDDEVTGINGGEINPKTIMHVLSSEMPCLQEIWLNVDFEGGYGTQIYHLPISFLENITSQKMPLLTQLEISGVFEKGTKEKILAYPIGEFIARVFIRTFKF